MTDGEGSGHGSGERRPSIATATGLGSDLSNLLAGFVAAAPASCAPAVPENGQTPTGVGENSPASAPAAAPTFSNRGNESP